MVSTFQDSSVLLALIATLPAIISWWSGRGLAALVDDPILPERLIAQRRRNACVAALAVMGLAVISTRSLIWTLPLTLLALHVGAYSLRKAVFSETWTLLAYLSFFGRTMVGVFGLWLLLAGVPWLASAAGSADWIVGLILAPLLALWNLRYADAVRLCLRTRPLEPSPLLARCRLLAESCNLPQPAFERIDLNGGVVANALALPSPGGASVLFTDTLLARLTDDEAAAICAHELAHLEYYNPQRLRRIALVSYALIGVACAWTPALRFAGFAAGGWTTAAWLALLTAVLALRARGKQVQETVCDVRAVGLVGAEPLISALTKLYTIARIPRRVELQQDQSGSHPSLARRIRDIRKAAGTAPATLDDAASFTSADGRTVVTFDASTLRWLGADAVTQSIEYINLAEVRIDARRSNSPRLIVRGSRTQQWEMSLAPADVARAQSVLDVVDSRLGEMPAAPVVPFKFSRPMVAVLMLMTVTFGHLAVAVMALLAWIRFAPPLLIGAGLAALTAAALAWRDATSGFMVVTAMPIAVAGAALLLLAWSNRKEAFASLRPMLAVVGVLALLSVSSIALAGIDAIRLHQSARTTPSATVLLVGLAGALACVNTRRARVAGAMSAAAAALVAVLGSSLFLDRFGSDPFLVDSPAIKWVTVDAPALEEFALPTFTSKLRLSPDGRAVAALDQADSADDMTKFHVGRVGEALTPVEASDLLFADDEHLLIAATDQRGTTVKTVTLSGREVVWQQRVDDLIAPVLTLDAASQKWRLTGWTADRGMARAEGVIGSAQVDAVRWPADDTDEAMVGGFTTMGRDALVVESRYDAGVFDSLSPRWQMMSLLLQRFNQKSKYWRLGPDGRRELGVSRLGADCRADVTAADALVCLTFDGTRTRLFTLHSSGRIEGLGWLNGRFSLDQNGVPGWLSGWMESTPAAIRLATGQAFRLPMDRFGVTHVTANGDRLAAVIYDHHGAKVRTYQVDRIEPPTTRAGRE